MTLNEEIDMVSAPIREGKWCKGTYDVLGNKCLAGWIMSLVACKLAKALSAKIKQNIPDWNDASGRTKEEVLALLESCREPLEAK